MLRSGKLPRADYWPNLALLGCWKGATVGNYIKKLPDWWDGAGARLGLHLLRGQSFQHTENVCKQLRFALESRLNVTRVHRLKRRHRCDLQSIFGIRK